MHRPFVVLAFAACSMAAAAEQAPKRFDAQLVGFNASGQVIPTKAVGHAVVEVIDDGTALSFQVNVAGIDNLLMAHIHVAPDPVQVTDPAGPIVFWFTGGPPPGATVTEPVNGTLARGFIITDAQLSSWDPTDPGNGTVQGLIAAIEAGRASVVVHTDDLDDSTPTGTAGDSRAGEIRGTLQ